VKTVGATARSAGMGKYRATDTRSFQVAARDTAGNIGAKTRRLVLVPKVKKLTLGDATARLTARGLKRGALSYSYSDSIASGHVIRGMISGLVAKGTAVGLRISRGGEPRTPTPLTPPPTYGGTPPPSIYTPPSLPTGTGAPPTYPPPTTAPSPTTPSPEANGSASPSPDPETVEPESFSPDDEEASGLRRLLGLSLLGGAFLAAGAMALRARRPRVKPSVQDDALVEPLLFWDQRLLQTVTSTVRRLTGR
jgi:hypothetical protein